MTEQHLDQAVTVACALAFVGFLVARSWRQRRRRRATEQLKSFVYAVREGRPRTALALLETVLPHGKTLGLSQRLVLEELHRIALLQLGCYEDALRGVHPGSAPSLRLRAAQAAIELGEVDVAESLLGEGFEDDRPAAEGQRHHLLARLRFDQGRVDEARDLLIAMASDEGDAPEVRRWRALSNHSLSAMALRTGDPTSAVEHAEQAVAAIDDDLYRPAIAFMSFTAAEAFAASGDTHQATDHLQRGLAVLPQCEEVPPLVAAGLEATAMVCLAQGDRDAARADLQRALDLQRDLHAVAATARLKGRLRSL